MSVTEFATLDLFCELAAIPSPSGRERAVADRVLDYLRGLGLEPDEDDAGGRIGSEIGNIYCHLPPSEGAAGTPIFLNAHVDTVPPTTAVDPVVADGVVTNANDTILGADNKAAVASMLIAVRDLVNSGEPHSGVELVITPMEEVGLLGAKEFDASRLRARFGYCYDHAAPIGNIVIAAPSQQTFKLDFRGRPAHSGIAPEDGRSAILAASRAIASMPLGRIDDQTTANVGMIEGGVARNIVPPGCTRLGRGAQPRRGISDPALTADRGCSYLGRAGDRLRGGDRDHRRIPRLPAQRPQRPGGAGARRRSSCRASRSC